MSLRCLQIQLFLSLVFKELNHFKVYNTKLDQAELLSLHIHVFKMLLTVLGYM